jgi:hypothetical protein
MGFGASEPSNLRGFLDALDAVDGLDVATCVATPREIGVGWRARFPRAARLHAFGVDVPPHDGSETFIKLALIDVDGVCDRELRPQWSGGVRLAWHPACRCLSSLATDRRLS